MTPQSPTAYPKLNALLQAFVENLQAALGDTLTGVYLQGSFAVGDFDPFSDVDFVVVVSQDLSPADVSALQAMHKTLWHRENRWAKRLEGSYFSQAVLRDASQTGRPLWYLDHGSQQLIESEHCNTLVVRWTLREYGLTLTGPPPTTLLDPIPVAALRREIYDVIVNWGQQILDAPETYNNVFYQRFIVLNFCRMLHDMRQGSPGSKVVSTAWAKDNLDPAWRGLIDRSWKRRGEPFVTVRQPADPDDYQHTLAFVRYIIDQARQYAQERDFV